MANCASCGVEVPEGKYGFRMSLEEGGETKIAIFCRECGKKMSLELQEKIREKRKAQAAEKEKL